MKALSKILALALLTLTSPIAFGAAGTSSGGGLLVPEQSVRCTAGDDTYQIVVAVANDPSTGARSAVIQQSSLDALWGPLEYADVQRDDSELPIVRYEAPKFALLVDVTTGEGLGASDDVIGGIAMELACTVTY